MSAKFISEQFPAATITLDAELQSKDPPSHTSSHSTPFLRTVTSIWNHRLWNLKEFILPRQNYIVFTNDLCSIDEIAEDHTEYDYLVATRANLSISHLM